MTKAPGKISPPGGNDAGRSSTSLAVAGPILLAIAANAMQLLGSILNWPVEYGLIGFIALLFGAIVFITWHLKNNPRGSNNIILASVGVVLVSVFLFFGKYIPFDKIGFSKTPPASEFYMKIVAYDDEDENGKIDGDEQAAFPLKIAVYNKFNQQSLWNTDKNGSVIVPLANDGQVYLGVCHTFQSHVIPASSIDSAHAYIIYVGIDMKKVTCDQ